MGKRFLERQRAGSVSIRSQDSWTLCNRMLLSVTTKHTWGLNSGKTKKQCSYYQRPNTLLPWFLSEGAIYQRLTSASYILPVRRVVSTRDPPTSRQHRSRPSFASTSPLETEVLSLSPHPVNSFYNALLWRYFTVCSFPIATSQNIQLWVWVCPWWLVLDADSTYHLNSISRRLPVTRYSQQFGSLMISLIILLFSLVVTHFNMLALVLTRLCHSQVLQHFWTWWIKDYSELHSSAKMSSYFLSAAGQVLTNHLGG